MTVLTVATGATVTVMAAVAMVAAPMASVPAKEGGGQRWEQVLH